MELAYLSDEDLESMIDDADENGDGFMRFYAQKEKNLRLLGDSREAAEQAADNFGLTMDGYMNSEDASYGYLVTDRKRTQTTFVIKSLDSKEIANKYASKIIQYHPKNWESYLESLSDDVKYPYFELLKNSLEKLDAKN